MQEKSSSSKREVIIVAVLVVLASVFLFILSRPEPPAAPVAVQPVASATPAPSPTPSARGSAVEGTIEPPDLIRGLSQLDKGPHPLTKEQAAAVADCLEGKSPAIEKSYRVVNSIGASLTTEQKAFLTKRYTETYGSGSGKYVPPTRATVTAFSGQLASQAGGGAASGGAASGGGAANTGSPELPPKPFASDLLVEFGSEMERNPSLRLSPAQVRQLSGQYQSYPSTGFSGYILDVLTPEQRVTIDTQSQVQVNSGSPPPPDVDPAELLRRLRARK